jgi:hypothetical protein
MRWIVITLILINVAYFVWQQQFVSTPVAEISAPAAATDKQLRLASEINEVTAPVAVEPSVDAPLMSAGINTEQHAPVTNEQRTPPLACYSIGPFLLVNDVSNTANIFEGVEAIATQQRATAERNQIGYWVYVPPLESLQAARTVLRDLQEKEIREVLIISEGVKANAISAGVYNVEAQAQERRDSIRVLGYQAEIDPLYRTQPQYWLDVDLMKAQTIPSKLWQKVSRNFPNITQTQRACE